MLLAIPRPAESKQKSLTATENCRRLLGAIIDAAISRAVRVHCRALIEITSCAINRNCRSNRKLSGVGGGWVDTQFG
jgi:hypothetical protein